MLQPSTANVFVIRQRLGINRYGSAVILWLTLLSITSYAQGGFVSGSTGADGAFNPTSSVTVPLPESGVFNFTTINIPANVTIRFGKNSRNTPVTLLATGNVTIAGTIDVSGSNGIAGLGGAGGPGGFNGGNGGPATGGNSLYSPSVNGDGPGGGGGAASPSSPNSVGAPGGGGFGNPGQDGQLTANQVGTGFTIVNGIGGPRYGLPTLLPLIGGSGGGGEVGRGGSGGGGGGGGGAILIASSGTINSSGNALILSQGGTGSARVIASAGGGSGGAVRLIANVISGTLRIDAAGGSSSSSFGGDGAGGYIRIEAFDANALNLTPTGSPRISMTTPKAVTASNLPVIRIASVAGVAPPNLPNGSLQGGPDIILPASQPNPVTVALTASNIPLGTILQVILTPENGPRIVTQSTALTGTLAASTATASITVSDGISVIQASGTIDVAAGGQSLTVNGEKVKRIEVNTVYGGDSVVTYVTESNKRIRAVR